MTRQVAVASAQLDTPRAPDATSTALPRRMATRAEPARETRAVPAPEQDDRVEVSIGSIHVRVEAPAPVLATQPSPARAERAAIPSRTQRSGLARRVLHRI